MYIYISVYAQNRKGIEKETITADPPIYAAEKESPETSKSFHHSIQYQVD